MQINNNFSIQNFGAIKMPSKTPKAVRNFIDENVTAYINPLLINKMHSLGYDIRINPRFYKKVDNISMEEVYMYVADSYEHGRKIPFVTVEAAAIEPKRLAEHVKKWNSVMCRYFDIGK